MKSTPSHEIDRRIHKDPPAAIARSLYRELFHPWEKRTKITRSQVEAVLKSREFRRNDPASLKEEVKTQLLQLTRLRPGLVQCRAPGQLQINDPDEKLAVSWDNYHLMSGSKLYRPGRTHTHTPESSKLMRELRWACPDFFDKEGKPGTALQTVKLEPIRLRNGDMNTSERITARYIAEVKKILSAMYEHFKDRFPDKPWPSIEEWLGPLEELDFNPAVCLTGLKINGTILDMPEAFTATDSDAAEKQIGEIRSEGFLPRDLLTGLRAIMAGDYARFAGHEDNTGTYCGGFTFKFLGARDKEDSSRPLFGIGGSHGDTENGGPYNHGISFYSSSTNSNDSAFENKGYCQGVVFVGKEFIEKADAGA